MGTISNYKKWIWQYKKRIAEYTERTDLNKARKQGMIDSAKYKIKFYQTSISYLNKVAKKKLGSIKKIRKDGELFLFQKTNIKVGLYKNTNIEELFIFKFLLENGFKTTEVSKEFNCQRHTTTRRRTKLNKILIANKDIKRQYISFVKELKTTINGRNSKL